ncbi:MAG: lantibiotic protection ABC transporter ATP-binding protein [Agathobacter sp.]|nr:lantibiotic protection ABC transporter ATP-binding protein [Agathobacter sp.]
MKMILQTQELTKKYNKKKVVNQISLHVPENSVYGLLGPNGAGKTTILKMISGIVRPTTGNILFQEHEWSRNDLSDIGALIENPPIYNNLTAYENMNVRTMTLGIDDNNIERLLDIVGLQDVGKKRAGQFSLGMKQRLGIALALLNHPKLLILDEPTNGLDPFGIEELRMLLRHFADEGITVILSSHILSEVQQVADYIGIITEGSLKYESKIDKNVNLEELFLNIAKNRRSVACSI